MEKMSGGVSVILRNIDHLGYRGYYDPKCEADACSETFTKRPVSKKKSRRVPNKGWAKHKKVRTQVQIPKTLPIF